MYNKAKKPFYDSWESLDEQSRQDQILKKLDEYITYTKKNCNWYKDRLADYNKNDSHPLTKIPILQSSDLRKLLPPVSQQMLTSKGKGYTVFQSGGTTGFPKTALFTNEELEGLNLPNARGFYAVGLNNNDKVANLWAVGGLYMTFIHMNRILQQYGCINFPFANNTTPDFVKTVTELFKINCFTGISSVVLSTLRSLYDNGVRDLEINKIYYGGEHFYEADRIEVEKKFGTKIVAAPGYGTVDTWYIGYQCSESKIGEFHAHDDQAYLEIFNEKEGKPCDGEEIGMLYVTAFHRKLTPIIRYKVGDRARWISEQCSCGRTTKRFKLLGRGDDVLRIGFDSIDYNDIQDACLKTKLVTGTLQLEKKRINGKDCLIIRVETEENPSDWENIKQVIIDEIMSRRPTLRKAIQGKSVWPIEIELFKIQSLKHNERTGKLIRIIDSIKDS